MMLHRSTSSRRRRQSRSVASPPQQQHQQAAQQQPPPRARRASVASAEPATEALMHAAQAGGLPGMERQRSPRGSCVPNIAFDADDGPREEPPSSRRLLPDPEQCGASRLSLAPDPSRSPRGSLLPDEFAALSRSPRGSLVPEPGGRVGRSRSPRHSLVPDGALSPRSNSLVPLDVAASYSRSPRGSLVPAGSRASLMAPEGNGGGGASRSPRHSLVPDGLPPRSPRGSLATLEFERSPARSPRGSLGEGPLEGTAAPSRSPRGSIGQAEGPAGRSPRGSIGMLEEEPGPEQRSPRGSLAGLQQGQQQPRRGPEQQPGRAPRSYGGVADSRRASSSVSQFSGDESRRLCAGGPDALEKGSGPQPLGVAAYGSLAFQLKDAHLEASGTCDFVLRALGVIGKTMIVTVLLVFLSAMPLVMLILGVQFIRDCPREPRIPVYMVVGGTLGSVRMFWTLYSRIKARRPEVLSMPGSRALISPKKLASIALSCFLAGWFALGNYWILSIRWPDYEPQRFEPNRWCHKTLYIFSLTHLCIVYAAILASVLAGLGLFVCRILACPWPERYK